MLQMHVFLILQTSGSGLLLSGKI